MPPLTMSFRCATPSDRLRSATTSGVPPARATRSTMPCSPGDTVPPLAETSFAIASAAPFRTSRPFRVKARSLRPLRSLHQNRNRNPSCASLGGSRVELTVANADVPNVVPGLAK